MKKYGQHEVGTRPTQVYDSAYTIRAKNVYHLYYVDCASHKYSSGSYICISTGMYAI